MRDSRLEGSENGEIRGMRALKKSEMAVERYGFRSVEGVYHMIFPVSQRLISLNNFLVSALLVEVL